MNEPRRPPPPHQDTPRLADGQRRTLLRCLGSALLGALPLGGTARLFAAPADGPRFLLVFLRGGYDAANFLIPYSSDFYYEARPHIALARPGSAQPAPAPTAQPAAAAAAAPGAAPAAPGADGALVLDADWALAPAVRDTIGTLYLERQAAFVPFAGTDDLSRSHFETQDSIELGQASTGRRDFRSGFLGRLSQSLGGRATPIAFTDSLPLVFQGGADVPNVSLRKRGPAPFDARQTTLLDALYAGHPLEHAVRDGLALEQEVSQERAEEMQAANRNAINTQGFELEAERMAHLMRDRYRLGFIDVGGWDTHVNQGAGEGTLATNLARLGRGLATFADTLGSEWRNTVVVVVSEFGRTFRENGNRGTDHGHGSVYWILGGGIAGGRIAGAQQRVSRDTLFQNRDFAVLNDYRAVLGGLFRRLWSLSPAECARVFPGSTLLDLGVL